ncbi:hypothetical protein [Kaistella antarctica]|uniref:Outer membrane protein beta-barrel domain-containing protein n=1 Tax=Kaistella antarctica TaxID=266748 RepID=A0A3S4YQ92_9FLAO|nr:hypothetical protein [Kaistella antarctica]KEY19790.1 hypothetical protein HY04_00745 [Kaistella antarctica]SEV97669.1 hypothetical protein SAMN05421765_1627 [Kaistella antarctica]VEH96464.1 Uncharacterised protein [Kaistella antarctica]
MKTLQKILMFYILSSSCILQAQVNQKKGWDGVVKGGSFSLGYNNTMVNSATKEAYVLNSSGVSGDVFIPFSLFRKGWDGTVKGGNFGFNLGSTYNFGAGGEPDILLPAPFNIIGQTASEVSYRNSTSQQTGFRLGGGPQVNFNFSERFIFSPMVLAEYFSMTQNELSAIQTSEINGKPKEYTLWSLPETKTSGLAITPKIRLQYLFAKNFGVFADGAYIFGPKINTQVTTLVPFGKTNQEGQYEQQQVDLGTKVTDDVKQTSYNAFSASVGLSYSFGGKNGSGENPTPAKANINRSRSNIKQQISTNNDGSKEDKKETQDKKCKTYTAPKLLNDYGDEAIHLNKGKLNIPFIPSNNIAAEYKVKVWDISSEKKNIIHEKVYPAGFNGSISLEEFKKKEEGTVEIQIQVMEGKMKPSKNNKEIIQNSTCATFENGGFSNIETYRISTSCAADYQFVIDSAVCVKDKKVKVYAKIKFLNPNGIATPNPTMSNVTFKDNVTGLPITASSFSTSLSPLSLMPIGTFIPFNFELEGETCDKELRITYDVNWMCPTGPQHIIACQDTIKLPCCYCNYCDDTRNSNIQELTKTTTLLPGDNLGISQQFSINPKNISKIEAEVVYMHENEMDAACKVCRENENEVYTFINANNLSWNSGPGINAGAGNMSGVFPSKILSWSSNNKGNLQLNLTVALPGTSTLSCCERHGEICIRYKFTDIECKVCERLVCYTY